MTIEKPTQSTIALPTNKALLNPERGGIALRYEVKFFRGSPSMLYFADLWISLRPAGGDDRGVFHFVYKGQQPSAIGAKEQRLVSRPVDAGVLTFFINYTDGVYTFYINGEPVAGEIYIPFALLGNSIRTFSRGVLGDIATLSAALSAEPFTEAQMRSLSPPEAEWKMESQMTLLAPEVKSSEDDSICEGILGNAIIPAEEYEEFVSRPRPSVVIYVDTDHPDASDEKTHHCP
ncbi:hypothetical protein ACFL6S_29200 [Candidatus Poribacteria bacterium]